MTAIQIIEEIRQLPLSEKEQVARFVREWEENPNDRMDRLAEELAETNHPDRAAELKKQITALFYQSPQDAEGS